MEEEKYPVYKVEIDENDMETGVHMISLVDEPAMEVNWLKLSKQKLEFKADKEKKMLYGVFIMPNQQIERFDPIIGKYYVVFEKDEIEKIVKKFNKNNYNRNVNFMHGENMVNAFVVENFIVSERVNANFGFEVPDGAWAGSIHIENDDFWNTYVKTDSLKGFSIEIISKLIKMENFSKNQLQPSEIDIIKKSIEKVTNEDVDEILAEVVKTINDLMPDEYSLLEQLHDELMDILSNKELNNDEVYDMLKKKIEMISPKANEQKEDFLSRCIPLMISEGKDSDQAIAMCISMYENK
jgi:hypothetical protein